MKCPWLFTLFLAVFFSVHAQNFEKRTLRYPGALDDTKVVPEILSFHGPEDENLLMRPILESEEYNKPHDKKKFHHREYYHHDEDGKFHHVKAFYKLNPDVKELDFIDDVEDIQCERADDGDNDDEDILRIVASEDVLDEIEIGQLLYFGPKWKSNCLTRAEQGGSRISHPRHSLLEVLDVLKNNGQSAKFVVKAAKPSKLFETAQFEGYSERLIPAHKLRESYREGHPHEEFRKRSLSPEVYKLAREHHEELLAADDESERAMQKRDITSFLERALNRIKTAFTTFGKKIQQCVEVVVEAVCAAEDFVESGIQKIGAKVREGWEKVKFKAGEAKEYILNKLSFDSPVDWSDSAAPRLHKNLTKPPFNLDPLAYVDFDVTITVPLHFKLNIQRGACTEFVFAFGAELDGSLKSRFGGSITKSFYEKTLWEAKGLLPNFKIPAGPTGLSVDLEPVFEVNLSVEGEVKVVSDEFGITLSGSNVVTFQYDGTNWSKLSNGRPLALTIVKPTKLEIEEASIKVSVGPEFGFNLALGAMVPLAFASIGGPRLAVPVSVAITGYFGQDSECDVAFIGTIQVDASLKVELGISAWTFFKATVLKGTLWEPKTPLFKACWKIGKGVSVSSCLGNKKYKRRRKF